MTEPPKDYAPISAEAEARYELALVVGIRCLGYGILIGFLIGWSI